MLPEAERRRLQTQSHDAAERAARQARAERSAALLPFQSEKIQCPCCSHWGARYERIPHVGGHHQLGKTASLGGTDSARIACQCPSCGFSWKTDEPP